MFFLELQFKQEYIYRCLRQLDNNSTEVSLGLVVCDLIKQMAHLFSGVSGEGCSLHLFGLQCLDLLCAWYKQRDYLLFATQRSKCCWIRFRALFAFLPLHCFWTMRWRWGTTSTSHDIWKVLIHPAAVSAENVLQLSYSHTDIHTTFAVSGWAVACSNEEINFQIPSD